MFPVAAVRPKGAVDPFKPDRLSTAPVFELRPWDDFSGVSDNSSVTVYPKANVGAQTQATSGNRPVWKDGVLRFDGSGDNLAFTSFAVGTGGATNWTHLIVFKIKSGLAQYDGFCGGTNNTSPEGRALELYMQDRGWAIVVSAGNSDPTGGNPTNLNGYPPAYPSDGWIAFARVYTASGTQLSSTINGRKFTTTSTPRVATAGTQFHNIGMAYSTSLAAPMDFGYEGFCPGILTDAEIAKWVKWVKAKLAPVSTGLDVWLIGGQSNYGYVRSDMQTLAVAESTKNIFLPSREKSGTYLSLWFRDAVGGGYELCPDLDMSGCTNPTDKAYAYKSFVGGEAQCVTPWEQQLNALQNHAKDGVWCLWVQGETDQDDGTTKWNPVAYPNFNTTFAAVDTMSSTYGARLSAFMAYLRTRFGLSSLVCIGELPTTDPNYNGDTAEVKANRKVFFRSFFAAMATDPKLYCVDTHSFPHKTNEVHLTSSATNPAQSPYSGAEMLAAAALRLKRSYASLSVLPSAARLFAARLVEGGVELNAAGFTACATFASTSVYSSITSLVCPILVCTRNGVADTEAQTLHRKRNLVWHTTDCTTASILTQPANTTVAYTGSPNLTELEAAVSALLTGIGLTPDTITLVSS